MSAWARRDQVALGLGLLTALLIRIPLLPMEGLRGDIDQFVVWVHGIATGGLANAYDQDVAFPPVMTYVFGALAALDPAFRTVTDASDSWIRVAMKLPATLADFGLALVVAYALRRHPRWAVLAALGVALHPAVIYLSAWWGQLDSIYVLAAAIALLLAWEGHPIGAAVALAVAVLTKPQAVPLVIPFGAWFLARGGLRGAILAAAAGTVTVLLLWLPFVPADGPARYIEGLSRYQGDVYNVLSLRAWNLWWLVQQPIGGGDFVADGTALVGPLTPRLLGFALAGLGELVVLLAVWRRPSAERLALGLATAALVAFSFLTTMHERYAFAALAAFAFVLWRPATAALWLLLGAAFTLNVVAAAPPTSEVADLLPIDGPLGIAGSIAVVGLTLFSLWRLATESPTREAEPEPLAASPPG